MIIDSKELQNAVTTIRPSKEAPESNVVRFNVEGKSDEKLKKKFDDVTTVAMTVKTDKGLVCRVKSGRGGHFYNPLKEGSSKDYSLSKKDKTTHNNKFELKEVSSQSFLNYLKFLESKYDSFLLKAEREA